MVCSLEVEFLACRLTSPKPTPRSAELYCEQSRVCYSIHPPPRYRSQYPWICSTGDVRLGRDFLHTNIRVDCPSSLCALLVEESIIPVRSDLRVIEISFSRIAETASTHSLTPRRRVGSRNQFHRLEVLISVECALRWRTCFQISSIDGRINYDDKLSFPLDRLSWHMLIRTCSERSLAICL